jgi:hypothetical protein
MTPELGLSIMAVVMGAIAIIGILYLKWKDGDNLLP